MDPRQAAALAHSIFHTRATEDPDRVGGVFEECKVYSLISGKMMFTRPMFDNNATVYGPVQYNLSGTPSPGDRILIVWAVTVAGGLRPWVVGWSST